MFQIRHNLVVGPESFRFGSTQRIKLYKGILKIQVAEIISPGVADSFYLLSGFSIVRIFPWSLHPPRNPLNLYLYRTIMVESQNFLDPVLVKP